MICLSNISKQYGKTTVLEQVNWQLQEGRVYGLIGYNGSGKTTLLKTLAGIYQADSGSLQIYDQKNKVDGCRVEGTSVELFENEGYKKQMFLLTEEMFTYPQATLRSMRKFYKGYYPHWSDETYEKLLHLIQLNEKKKIAEFSKGMQRLAGILLALSTTPTYLYLDETFDGLDFIKRKILTSILKSYTQKKQAISIVTSHYIADLEAITDEIGVIYDRKLQLFDPRSQRVENLFYGEGQVSVDDIEALF